MDDSSEICEIKPRPHDYKVTPFRRQFWERKHGTSRTHDIEIARHLKQGLAAAAGTGPWLSGDRSRHRDIGGTEQHVVAGARYILSRGIRVCSGSFQRAIVVTE
jgi:hypothetical protein